MIVLYEAALQLWETRQRKDLLFQVASVRKPKPNSTVLKYQRLLAIARAKDWDASEFGSSHNTQSDKEDLDSPLPDHTICHPAASKEDIKVHIHKAVSSIGLLWESSSEVLNHPVLHREYILLLLRFQSSSLPSKTEFGLFVHIYLVHLKQAAEQIDQLLDKVKF
jgi:hypothetical protein